MAETVGVFGVVLQIATAASKLRGLWKEIKGAPEDLQMLMNDVAYYADLLACIQPNNTEPKTQAAHDASMRRCYESFKSAAGTLDRLTCTLSDILRQHKRTGALRLYLKKDILIKCTKRFEEARMALMFAQQIYATQVQSYMFQHYSLIQQIHALVADQHISLASLTASTTILQNSENYPCTPINQHNNHKQCDKFLHRDRNEAAHPVTVHLKIPAWILRRGVEICFRKSYSSLGIVFRTYNQISDGSPVCEFVRIGDIDALQELLSTGRASPYDETFDGWSLLHIAATNRQIEMCRFLLSLGTDIRRQDKCGFTPLSWMLTSHLYWHELFSDASRAQVAKLAYLLAIEHSDEECPLDDWALNDTLGSAPIETFNLFASSLSAQYSTFSPYSRAQAAVRTSSSNIDVLKFRLGSTLELSDALEMVSEDECNHRNLLRYIASNFARASDTSFKADWSSVLLTLLNFDSSSEWSNVMPSTIATFLASFAFHVRDYVLITECADSWNMIFTAVAKHWIRWIDELGVDLSWFATRERHALMFYNRNIIRFWNNRGEVRNFRIVSVVGGPCVDDWKVYVAPTKPADIRFPINADYCYTHDSETWEYEMAGGFWDQVENPELFRMPGVFPYWDFSEDGRCPCAQRIQQDLIEEHTRRHFRSMKN